MTPSGRYFVPALRRLKTEKMQKSRHASALVLDARPGVVQARNEHVANAAGQALDTGLSTPSPRPRGGRPVSVSTRGGINRRVVPGTDPAG